VPEETVSANSRPLSDPLPNSRTVLLHHDE